MPLFNPSAGGGVPKVSGVYAFRAYLSSDQTVNGAWPSGKIIFLNTAEYDNGSNVDLVNGWFTAPVAGRYKFMSKVAVNSNFANSNRIGFQLNANTTATNVDTGVAITTFAFATADLDINLNQGDTISLYIITGAGGAVVSSGSTPDKTYMTGHLTAAA